MNNNIYLYLMLLMLNKIWNRYKGFFLKESACNAGDPGLIPGSGRSSGEGVGYPLQYSWVFLVAELVKNPPAMRETWIRSWVGKIPWRRERLPTPVFWPRAFHGLYSPWGCKELNMTEWLSLSLFTFLNLMSNKYNLNHPNQYMSAICHFGNWKYDFKIPLENKQNDTARTILNEKKSGLSAS